MTLSFKRFAFFLLFLTGGVLLRAQAQSGDLEVVSIDPVPASLNVNGAGELLLVVNQNGPGTLPTGSARVTITINTAIINWVTPFSITDGCGNLWTVFTSGVTGTTTTVQIRNSQPLPSGTGCEIHLPIRGVATGSAAVTVASTVFGAGVSDPVGTNQSATTTVLVETATPVTLSRFQAYAAGADARLEWTTSSERNNAFFEILHSVDGKTFEPIGKVTGKGTTTARNTYAFTDAAPDRSRIHYYRLRQVDYDGTSSLSGVQSVQFEGYVGIVLSAYPDATRTIRVRVDYGDDQLPEGATVSLLDLSGRQLAARQMQLSKGRNEVLLESRSLAAGLYLVRLENASKPAAIRIVLP